MLDAVDPRFQQLLYVIIIENVSCRLQAVFPALADDLPHQLPVDLSNVSLFIEIPVVAALVGKFQEIDAGLFQLPDPFAHLRRRGNLNGHFLLRPGAVRSQCAGRMPARRCKVRSDDQQLRPGDPAGSQLIAQFVNEMLRRVQILDGGNAIGQHAFAE